MSEQTVFLADYEKAVEALAAAVAERDSYRERLERAEGDNKTLQRIAWLVRQDRFGDAREMAREFFVPAGGVST